METISQPESHEPSFVFPVLQNEHGEIERVAHAYCPDSVETFIQSFYESAQGADLTDLTEDMWQSLENTDSFDIPIEGWDKVNEHIVHTNEQTGAHRDWEDIQQKMEGGQALDAPIILKYKGSTHLVSGNTRLMVARALGKTPQVLIVEM